MSYKIVLPIFEGPFDLLFHLIDKNEVDIYDIPIAKITEQYLEYIQSMQQLDLDVASEFLVMAANLLSIKAKMLLPKPPKEENPEEDELGLDPRDELVERLLEYRKFKMVAEHLKDKEQVQGRIYTRPNDEEMYMHLFNEENPLEGVSIFDLLDALKDVLNRVDEEVPTAREIPREEVSIRDKMREVLRRMVFHTNGLAFRELFVKSVTRVEVVVTFLAVLELIKLRKIQIHQSRLFGEIMIYNRREEMAQ
ncbi:MAG: segregation/condensation protein A [Clostridia bacterium]|nr:segregation/condensation protein A [Clostridia bacterium]